MQSTRPLAKPIRSRAFVPRRGVWALAVLFTAGALALARAAGEGSADDLAAASPASVSAAPSASGAGSDASIVVVPIASDGAVLDVLLRRAGLSPRALAAAGVTPTEFGALLQAADGWLQAHPGAVDGLDAAVGAARAERDRLARRVKSGLASPEEVAALAQAKQACAAAEDQRDALLAAARQAACADLAPAKAQTLAQIVANRRWRFPAEYLVEAREQASWIRLRDALVNERQAPRWGDAPDPGLASFLTELRARPAAAAARANVETYLASLEASWDASLH